MGKKKAAEPDSLFLTGIPGIDDQHAEMIFMCDSILNRIKKESPSQEVIDLSIQEIIGCFKSHIVTEENLLEMIGFPEAAVHKAEHKKIFSKLDKKKSELGANKKAGFSRFVSSFRETIFNHIDVFDREYTVHIEKLMGLKKKYKITALKAQTLTD